MIDLIGFSCGKNVICGFYIFTDLAPTTRTSWATYNLFNRIKFRSNKVISYFPAIPYDTIEEGEKTSSSLITLQRSLSFVSYVAASGIPISKNALTGGVFLERTLPI